MKKVNYSALAVGIVLGAILVWTVVETGRMLVGFAEINENLMGRNYNTPDED